MRRLALAIVLALLSFALATCGGGGGGSTIVSPPACAAVLQVAVGSTGSMRVAVPAGATVEVSPLPLPPNSTFDGTTFTFAPAPYQAGLTYELRWRTRLGALSSQPCPTSITVLPGTTVGGTTLAGVVKAARTQTPIANVRVNIPGTALETHTSADGSFTLAGVPTTASVVEIHGIELTPAYAFVAEPLELLLLHPLYPGVVNAIARPIYIPRLGAPGGMVDSTSAASSIINGQTSCGPVTLEVLPHSALLNGSPYNGPIYIPEVNRNQTPASLPSELVPGLVIAIQPAGVRFNPPARVTFPNCDHLPAGTETDIWSINPNTGRFAVAGKGQVSVDGASVSTLLGGVTAASWHMTLPPRADPSGGTGGTNTCPLDDEQEPILSSVLISSGTLRTSHALPSYWVLGQEQSVQLTYQSDMAAPTVLANALITIPVQSTIPLSITAQLEFGGADLGGYTTDTHTLSENLDEPLFFALQRSAESYLTGVYSYTLRLTNHFLTSDVSADLHSKAIVINNSTGPYGAGWCVDGLNSLAVQQDGSVLVLDGHGGGSVFQPPVEPGPGLVMRMFSNATQPDVHTKFANRPAGIFTAITAAGTTTSDRYVVPTIDHDAAACGTATNAGPFFYYRGPDHVISTTSTSNVLGDDVLFMSPGNADVFGASFTGYIYLPESGNLHFSYAVDNDFDMFIDGALVHSIQDGCPALRSFDLPNQTAGFHSFEMYFLDWGINATVFLQGTGCGLPGGIIPPGFFYTALPGGTFTPTLQAPPGDFSSLTRLSPDEFRHRTRNGVVRTFRPSGTNPNTFLLSTLRDRNGTTWQYMYDSADRITNVRDPLQHTTSFAYDPAGRLSSVTDPFGRMTGFVVNGSGDLTTITDPDGSVERFEYAGHRMTSHTSKRGFRATYAYDGFGRLAQTRWPDGTERHLVSQVSRSTFDPASGLGTQAQPAAPVRPETLYATWTDAAGVQSRHTLDGFGGSLSTVDGLGRVTTLVRDGDGLATQIRRPDGAVDRTSFVAGNPVLVVSEGDNGPGSDDRTWRYTWGTGFNELLSVLDANGNVNPATGVTTKYEYDSAGNLTRVTDAENHITQFVYDEAGQGVAGIAGLLTSVIDSAGKRSRYFYHAITGNLARAIDPTGRVTSFEYDAFGRRHSVRAEGDDNNTATDQATTFDYDVLNRVVAVTDNLGHVTRTEYDSEGNVTLVRDANPQPGITRFAYDPLGRVVTKTDPLNNNDTYTYTPNGDLLTHVDRNGQTTTFAYDNARRLLRRDFSGGGFTQYGYGVVDDLTSVSDPDSNLTFTYSPFGDLLTASTAGSPLQPDVTITYAYDKNGNRVSMTPSTGGAVTYTSDKLNRLDGMADASAAVAVDFHYDAVSRRDFMTRTIDGQTLRTDYIYDDAGNLLSLAHQRVGAPAPISRFQYGLNSLGLRSRMTEDRAALGVVGAVHDYTYDGINQLISADHPATGSFPDEAFTYDAVGNRRTSAQTPGASWSYNVANQLLNSGDLTYTYDLNGNQSTRASVTQPTLVDRFFYDADNQLVRLEMADGRVFEYAYDGLGRRIRIRATGAAPAPDQVFVYDQEDILLEQAAGDTTRYTHGPGIDEPLMVRVNGGIQQIYVTDGLGTVTETVTNTGVATGAWAYDSFGQREVAIAGTVDNYGFAGREHDASGALHCRARSYSAEQGRFTTQDPIDELGTSAYVYVSNSPLGYIDPSGRGKVKWFVRAIGGAWRVVTRDQARRQLKDNACDIKVTGPGKAGQAKRLGKDVFGDKNVRHDPHGPDGMSHYQHRNGGRGHIFYSSSAALLPYTAAGAFGDNVWTEAVDLFNPASDAQEILDLLGELTDDDQIGECQSCGS